MELHLLFYLVLQITLVQGWWFVRDSVEYPHIGSFDKEAPFDDFPLPQSPSHINIQFLLFTRKNSQSSQQLDPYNANTVTSSNFDGAMKTFFITHGYQSDWQSPYYPKMKDELLIKDDFNVILVDWEGGADNYLDYEQSASNTRVVGATIGEMMISLVSSQGASYNRFHLIGHSLGAHVMGHAGAYVNGAPWQITGLDPAGPSFENTDPLVRLDPSDAQYVEVIHTDGNWQQLGFGLVQEIGHTDYYVNGGDNQPGCSQDYFEHLFTLIIGKIDEFADGIACSHMRALDLYIESINSACLFSGRPCSSDVLYYHGLCEDCGSGCSIMGFNSNVQYYGTFYLETNAASPFCIS